MGRKDKYMFSDNRTRYWCSILEHQREVCQGKDIPKSFILEYSEQPGFFFGIKSESMLMSGEYVGKPVKQDAHVLVAGESGRGKTQCIVLPTMATWTGSQIILDVKGDLYGYWDKLNRGTGKMCVHFSLGKSNWKYDPYAPLRHGGTDNLGGKCQRFSDGTHSAISIRLRSNMDSVRPELFDWCNHLLLWDGCFLSGYDGTNSNTFYRGNY